MCSKYLIYEKNRLKVYREPRFSNDLICACETLEDAEEMVLTLTEDYEYRCFCENCQYFNVKDSLTLLKIVPKFSWDKYTIKQIGC